MNKIIGTILLTGLFSVPVVAVDGNSSGGGVAPAEYAVRLYQLPVSNETKTAQLYPAKIKYEYSESRYYQGVFNSISATFHINVHELWGVFKLSNPQPVFSYVEAQGEGSQVRKPLDYNEYSAVFNAITDSQDHVSRKVTAILSRNVIRVLKVVRKVNKTEIENCTLHDEERSDLEFKTKEGPYKFGKYDASKDLDISVEECQKKIAEFEAYPEPKIPRPLEP